MTVPALPAGSAAVTVTNLAGLTTASPVPVVVRDLDPFRDSGAYADRQYRDFLGRGATASDRLAADSALGSNASLGTLPTSLARSTPTGRTGCGPGAR